MYIMRAEVWLGTNAIYVCVTVLVAMVAYGCRPDVPALERKFAADGQFWAGLQVDTGSGIAGGTWYSVVVGKAQPRLRDTLIRNSMKATRTLQGPGELALSWIENRHFREFALNVDEVLSQRIWTVGKFISIQNVFK
jgi:hypothetical protein